VSDPAEHSVTIQVTAQDKAELEDLVDGSPFPEQTLLRLALRIGMTAIRKEPKVLLSFMAKESKKPG
jgi:hypothetical protein